MLYGVSEEKVNFTKLNHVSRSSKFLQQEKDMHLLFLKPLLNTDKKNRRIATM